MIYELVLPQLAMGMSEGTIVEWAVAEGQRTERDQALLAIETEKVVTDLPAPRAGFVHIVAAAGSAVPVDTLIGRIADTEEEYRALLQGGAAPAAAPAAAAVEAAASTPPSTATAPAGRIKVSGLARKLAHERGLDLAQLSGSGPQGRIVQRDIVRAAAAGGAPSRRMAARVPLTGMRKTIATRMVQAKQTAAHTYSFFEIDITRLVAARERLPSDDDGSRVSMVALQARSLALALRDAPILNATIEDEQIVVWDTIDVGVAVALPGRGEHDSGLVVPVLRDVGAKGVQQIDRELRALVDKARSGSLRAADMAGATVTLSSTGGFLAGTWCVSTPLLNLPQVLNFQPGTPVERPCVVDGRIVARTVLPCGLSFDHRATDGAPVGRLVQRLSALLSCAQLGLLAQPRRSDRLAPLSAGAQDHVIPR